MAVGGELPMSEVQLRVALRKVRSRSASGQNGEDMVDSALLDTLRRQKPRKQICTPCRLCLGVPFTLILCVYLFFFVLPVYYEPSAGYITRLGGQLSYPIFRVFRKVTLPVTSFFPGMKEYYTAQCVMNNPWYEELEEEDPSSMPGSSGSSKKSTRMRGLECQCIGVRSVGRVKNRNDLKVKHVLQNPGKPLLLTLRKEYAEFDMGMFLNISGDGLAENLCQLEPKKEKESCVNAAAYIFNALARRSTSDPLPLETNYAWSYCPYSRGVDKLLTWIKPESYLVGKDVKISRHISMLLGQKGGGENLPLPMPMEHDIHVLHQVFGQRTFYLEPFNCTKCSEVKVSLKGGQALFFDAGVWSVALEAPTEEEWSLTVTYSVAKPGTKSEPYDETGNCA